MAETTIPESPSAASGRRQETPPGRGAAPPPAPWKPGTRVAFRFCFAYFILFTLSNQIVGGLLMAPKVDIEGLGVWWPLRPITFWTAAHVFGVRGALVYTGSGSGDKTFDWVQAFCLLVIAAAVMAVWSVLDRRRANYAALYKWFRLFVRFALASEMFIYGSDKIIPLQMPFPSLTRLLEPYGNFTPMSVLWSSVGASRAYEIFAGSAETLGGLLLILPATTTLGALVCLADLTQVFTLNMTYDVPVKLFSFHLILFAVFLLAPELRRLATFFFTSRPVAPAAAAPFGRTARSKRAAVLAQLAYGAYLIGANVYGSVAAWHEYGGARLKPGLYGIWNVEQMSVDGQARPPLLTDTARWRRVIFDFAEYTQFQAMDDTFTSYASNLDLKAGTLTLKKRADKKWSATFALTRPAPDELRLDGSMDGHRTQAQLKRLDLNQYMLVKRGFHWINEYPFQR